MAYYNYREVFFSCRAALHEVQDWTLLSPAVCLDFYTGAMTCVTQ